MQQTLEPLHARLVNYLKRGNFPHGLASASLNRTTPGPRFGGGPCVRKRHNEKGRRFPGAPLVSSNGPRAYGLCGRSLLPPVNARIPRMIATRAITGMMNPP